MSYARARLLLGMSGVGLIVVSSTLLLFTQYPLSILPTTQEWSKTDQFARHTLDWFSTGVVAA